MALVIRLFSTFPFISQPSLSNAGGVGFYIKENLTFTVLSELSVTKVDFEALWIEINCDGQSNLICGVVYRHPNGNLDNFMDYMNKTIEKIHLQNKYSLIMGDFNIDLLNSCKPSDDFINTLASFYQPQILQPTRITDGKQLQQDSWIKYLGILIDTNLSWKPQIACIVKKIQRSVGILSKLRHYLNIDILTNLYYSIIHPFLTCGIIIWGNTYSTTLQPSYILQKKAVRIMTFSSFDEHSTPLFRLLVIMKLSDLVTLHIALFMHKFHNKLLPSYFDNFFNPVLSIHDYNT